MLRSYIFFGGLLLLFLSSCITKKQFDLLQPDRTTKSAYKVPDPMIYRIECGDFLYVKYHLPKWSDGLKSFPTTAPVPGQGEAEQKFQNQYPVTEHGHVVLPEVGEVSVAGKTIDECRTIIHQAYKKTYKEIEVRVELAYFNFVVLGEVNGQGSFRSLKRQLTLLEAIGMAGGFTPEADRNELQLVRRENGESKVYVFSLNDRSILESDLYFIRPNDVITVNRLKESFQRMSSSPLFSNVQLSLSLLSSLLVFVFLFQK